MKTHYVSYQEIDKYLDQLAEQIDKSNLTGVYGIPRGGVAIALGLSKRLELPMVEKVSQGILVVDDLIDSGATVARFSGNPCAVLFIKPQPSVHSNSRRRARSSVPVHVHS